jgi:hypothetical protein
MRGGGIGTGARGLRHLRAQHTTAGRHALKHCATSVWVDTFGLIVHRLRRSLSVMSRRPLRDPLSLQAGPKKPEPKVTIDSVPGQTETQLATRPRHTDASIGGFLIN